MVARKRKEGNVSIRHVSALLEVGEILYDVLTAEEKRALQGDRPDIEKIEAKRRYRWDETSRQQ